MSRSNGRQASELRNIQFHRHYTAHAEGSVLVEYGNTKVICTASVGNNLPRFLRDSNQGWLTAEYGMLPRATHSRTEREAAKGKQSGRTQEIQRLIGRALRQAIDLSLIPDYSITIDCDVIQADGGTRTAAISGSAIALADAVAYMHQRSLIRKNPLRHLISSVSVGIVASGEAVVDLDYAEDSNAQTDMNVVMTDEGNFIEFQGTAELKPFTAEQLNAMLGLAQQAGSKISALQKQALGLA